MNLINSLVNEETFIPEIQEEEKNGLVQLSKKQAGTIWSGTLERNTCVLCLTANPKWYFPR